MCDFWVVHKFGCVYDVDLHACVHVRICAALLYMRVLMCMVVFNLVLNTM